MPAETANRLQLACVVSAFIHLPSSALFGMRYAANRRFGGSGVEGFFHQPKKNAPGVGGAGINEDQSVFLFLLLRLGGLRGGLGQLGRLECQNQQGAGRFALP